MSNEIVKFIAVREEVDYWGGRFCDCADWFSQLHQIELILTGSIS